MTLPAGGKRLGAVFMSIGALGTRPRVTCVTALRAQRGFDVISPPLQPRPSESRQVPRLSDLTHLPPFGARLASPGGPRPTSRRVYCFPAKSSGSQTCFD